MPTWTRWLPWRRSRPPAPVEDGVLIRIPDSDKRRLIELDIDGGFFQLPKHAGAWDAYIYPELRLQLFDRAVRAALAHIGFRLNNQFKEHGFEAVFEELSEQDFFDAALLQRTLNRISEAVAKEAA